MINFNWASYDSNTNNPIISNADIANYAERLLAKHMPRLLKEAGPINFMRFLELALGANVEIQDIYYGIDEPAIMGMTVFDNSKVKLFDKENMSVREIICGSGTIILDKSMIEDNDESFARFTGLHEGGHFCLHPETFRRIRIKSRIDGGQAQLGDKVACSKKSIDNSSEEGLTLHGIRWDAEACREHQANVFSAHLAMPAKTFIPEAKAMIRSLGFEDYLICEEVIKTEYYHEYCQHIKRLARLYGMSFTATKNHLKNHGLLITRLQHELMHRGVFYF